ncbi:MAG: type transport system ATP-binding protein [Thermoleophilales bacterium]|nr:type transport system ATP-binding protein [Thermoleophilales bacterium]
MRQGRPTRDLHATRFAADEVRAAFGMLVASDFPLPGLGPAEDARPDVNLTLSTAAEIDEAWSGASGPPAWSTRFSDGREFHTERGSDGDYRFSYGHDAVFRWSAETGVLQCAPRDRDDEAWQRVLLDTVLLSVALLSGHHALHGSAVCIDGRAVAILAASGGGKSTLAAELLRRGARFLADDVVVVARDDAGQLIAHPGPGVMNLPVAIADLAPELGSEVARFDSEGELWLEIRGPADGPQPLAAVVVLDRGPGKATICRRETASVVDLLAHTTSYKDRSDGLGDQFALFSDLAERTPVFTLEADAAAPVQQVAQALLDCLPNGARTSPSIPALEVRGIAKTWPGRPAPVLDGLDFVVEPGTCVFVGGRNGIGKTTLLRIAAGLIIPDAGSVSLGGLDPERDRREYQRRSGFLSAGNTGLYARLTVRQQLAFWARVAFMPRASRGPAIERAIDDFALQELAEQRVDRLSLGQRQRVRLALTFLHGPDLVLLDEPGTSLDREGIAVLAQAVSNFTREGGAVVACGPDGAEDVLPHARAYSLLAGRLVSE